MTLTQLPTTINFHFVELMQRRGVRLVDGPERGTVFVDGVLMDLCQFSAHGRFLNLLPEVPFVTDTEFPTLVDAALNHPVPDHVGLIMHSSYSVLVIGLKDWKLTNDQSDTLMDILLGPDGKPH